MQKGGHSAKSGPRGGKKSAAGMREAWRLLDAGDVLAARREASRFLAQDAPPEERDEARELLERTRFPKQALAAAAIAATLIALLILLAVLRG